MLRKEIGLWGVFGIATGAMISSGLFLLPGIAFARVGPAMIVAYVLAGVLNLPAMFAQVELSTAMPKSGGSYFTIERSLGALAGTLAGLISWLCIALKAAFACVGIGALAMLLFPEAGEWNIKLVAIGACLFFTAINLLTVKGVGRLQGVLVAFLLGILVVYVVGSIGSVSAVRYSPFLTSDWGSLFAVTGMVFISFGGLTKVVDVAEEIKAPQRNLPLGMFLSFAVVNVLYVAVVFVTAGVLDGETLSSSLAPLSLGAKVTMGTVGVVAISFAAFLAYATTGNAGILSASRSPLAMSRDGLLPKAFARTSRRFGTPYTAIAVTALFIVFTIAFLSVEDLAKTASTMFLISFALANVSVIVMRRARLEGYRPSFKMPLCPWLNIAAVAVYAFLIVDMGLIPLLVTGVFLAVAGIWYVTYIHWRVERESAVVYLVKGILSKHIKRTGLEDELVRISLEREEIQADRFDELVRKAAPGSPWRVARYTACSWRAKRSRAPWFIPGLPSHTLSSKARMSSRLFFCAACRA
jgi:amino acid transporter